MFGFPDAVVPIQSLYNNGAVENGAVLVCKEGLVIETAVAHSVGLEWEQLLDIIAHPEVQERLAEAARARGE